MPASTPDIVYLHGFQSGPASAKARETAAWLGQHCPDWRFHAPKLSPYPAQAVAQADALLAGLEQPLLLGSSLGGYYASWLAERHDCRAVLINPAIRPYDDLARFLGDNQSPWTGERFTLTPAHMDELLALRVERPRAARYWLVLGTQDEVLDWREAARCYRGARMTVFNGDDHRLQRWPECLPGLARWAV